ncbi:MAG: radical SAM/SPASM domain-containing protein [Anaerolineae bacterium]
MADSAYASTFDSTILAFFRDALRQALTSPKRALFMLRTLRNQQQAVKVRREAQPDGVQLPAFMIMSITKQCNLHCKGCYSRDLQHRSEPELDDAKLRSVIAEARSLGISIILLSGGEPLTRPGILDITADFPEIIFPLFTNGMLIDQAMAEKLRRQPHVVPVISLEGHREQTDERRGEGAFKAAKTAMELLRKAGVYFGTAITVTNSNMKTVTKAAFIRDLQRCGSRVYFFVDYVPTEPGTEELALPPEKRKVLAMRIEALKVWVSGLFVAFPGDEERYGGCLAAGRGFVHVSPEGWLEPCPFSPYADTSLTTHSLKEALQSKLLRRIRENPGQLSELSGGCALWAHKDWVEGLLQE